MEQTRLERINELARIAKERALTPEEAAERQTLRQEYLQVFRQNMINTLDNVYLQREDGSVEKLKKKSDL